jgi:uncharacterized iron-regulated membrane protein
VAYDIVYDRPSEALGQGRWAASPWMIAAIAVLTVLITAGFVIWIARRRVRARQAEDGSPISSRRPSVRPGARPNEP